jgi:hypothetical protein
MTAVAHFKQADLARALKAALSAGLQPKSCRVSPVTGEIEVHFESVSNDPINSFDALCRAAQ